ncbi:hypothetical protein ACIRYZ_25375 [Kitasatospora sp. NPDC101155]|uniref:hypothetical protein n=1 Tax=Kitasatospora sp. NPDC101155 TaxID=3364097 RepID=UPI0037F139AF
MADPDADLEFRVKPAELDGCGQSAQHIGGLIPGETAKITDPCNQAAGGLKGWLTAGAIQNCGTNWKTLLDKLGTDMGDGGKASQLGIGADHVYVGTAKYDPVAMAPAPGMFVPGWAAYEAITNPDGLWHGTDPASQGFGAQRFSVADGTITDSRDNYFGKDDKGGDSLPNIGKIVSGHGNTITREDPR